MSRVLEVLVWLAFPVPLIVWWEWSSRRDAARRAEADLRYLSALEQILECRSNNALATVFVDAVRRAKQG